MAVVGDGEGSWQRVLVADEFHGGDRDWDGLSGGDGDGGLLATAASGVEDCPAPLVRGTVAPAKSEGHWKY